MSCSKESYCSCSLIHEIVCLEAEMRCHVIAVRVCVNVSDSMNVGIESRGNCTIVFARGNINTRHANKNRNDIIKTRTTLLGTWPQKLSVVIASRHSSPLPLSNIRTPQSS